MHGRPPAAGQNTGPAHQNGLSAYLRQAPGLIAVLSGPEYVFDFANQAYLDLIGRREVVGKSVRDALPEVEAQGLLALLDQVYATGEAFVGRQVPVALERPGSAPETRYFDFVYQPISDDGGQVTGIFASGLDVTDQVQAQEALKESEARFRLFSEESREGVVIHDGQTILDCNPAYVRLFGYDSVMDMVGRPITDVVAPESAAVLLEQNRTRAERVYEVEARRKDGSTFPAEFVGREAVWQGKRVRIGLTRDLTDQKARERALRDSEAHLAAIFSQAAAGLAETDLTGRFIRVNDRFCELVGRTRENLLSGLRMQDITHPDDLPANLPLFQRAVEKGEPFEIEKRYVRPAGGVVWVNNAVTPIRDDTGRTRTIASVSLDLTARREGEAAMRASERRLRLALDAGRMAVWESDTRTNSVKTTRELNLLLGFPADAALTIDEVRSRYAPGAREQLQAAVNAALERGDRHADAELEVIWPDGSHHWLLLRAELEASFDPNGTRHVKATGVALDITSRKRHEEHLRLLINELNHRVKNTLATVQSIATQTFHNTPEECRSMLGSFEDRLIALARAHDVLTRENWEGAELRDVIAQVLEPYLRTAGERFEIDGPKVRIAPRMALALSMAVHELVVNATKYGALSAAGGRVSMRWSVDPGDGQLALTWRERGGPPVVPPTRRGFGTRLIERSLALDLGGDVTLSFGRTGVACTVRTPWQGSQAPEDAPALR